MSEPPRGTPDVFAEATIAQSPSPTPGPGPAPIKIDGYRLLNEISRGGQAVVYAAQFLKTGRRVAVKIMRDGPLATESGRARFNREAQILASLNHPNIVTILDRGQTEDGSEYFAMDYISGKALDEGTWKSPEYLQSLQQGDAARPLQLFLKICDAVNAAHLRGIVHRDLKPSNIRLDERGEPHVLDFGLARGSFTGDSAPSAEPLTITGQFLGSLPWASPEQAEGVGDKIDTRSDVYSLGVILYQLVTGGRFPYQVVGSMRDVLNNIMSAEPPAPSTIMAERESRDLKRRVRRIGPPAKLLNPAVDAIVLCSLAKSRDHRYQSAGELARDIEKYLSGRPIDAAPAPASRPSRRLLVALAGAAVIALAVPIALLARRNPAPPVAVPSVAASPIAAPPVATTPSANPLIAASPLRSDYEALENLLNRFIAIHAYIHDHAPERIEAWKAAADHGDPVGQMLLARCYEAGDGLPQNFPESLRNLNQAADRGLPVAMCMLGIRLRLSAPPVRDYTQALEWYQRAADAGNARAMLDIGLMNMLGQGVPVNYSEAMRWLRKSADTGSPAAYTFIGDMYRNGNGVPIDNAEAFANYQRAADADVPLAMFSLGWMYVGGLGAPRDFSHAMSLFQKADAGDVAAAASAIGDLYARGQGVPQDFQKAAESYRKAATNAFPPAMRKLAALYDQGNGLPKNPAQALAWYTRAANNGDPEAKQWLQANFPEAPH